MSGPELDALLTHEDTPWRPSMAFLADLSERLDAVDAEIEAEREHIPQEGARAHDSVLFSLEALQGGRAPSVSRPRPSLANDPSGVIDLARLTAPPPEAVDSGPLAVGQEPALARRRRRTMWLAAAGFVLAAGGAVAVGGPTGSGSPGVPVDAPSPAVVASGASALDEARDPGEASAIGAAARGPAAPVEDAPNALRGCLAAPGAPARARIVWLAGRPLASDPAGGRLAEPVRRCLLEAARALGPRSTPLEVAAPR